MSSFTVAQTSSDTTGKSNAGQWDSGWEKFLGGFIEGLGKNPWIAVALIVAIAAVGTGVSFFMNSQDTKTQEANRLLYEAHKSLEKETQVLMAAQAPATPAVKKDAKTPAAPTPQTDVTFKKANVETTFPEALKGFQAVVTAYPGSHAAFEAKMSAGELYYLHGSPEQAAKWYGQAVDTAPAQMDRAQALSAQGYALENAGKYNEAADAFQKAFNLGQAPIKGDLMLSMARNQELAKDMTKARATYDQIIAQMPDSEAAKTAQILKSRLK